MRVSVGQHNNLLVHISVYVVVQTGMQERLPFRSSPRFSVVVKSHSNCMVPLSVRDDGRHFSIP